MLRITIVNVTKHQDKPPDDIASYSVRADVNGRTLKEWRVEGHYRADGWKELLRRVANEAGV